MIILGSDHDSPLDLADAAEAAGQLPLAGQDEYWGSLAAELSRWATSAITVILSTALLRNKARFYGVD